MYNLFSLLLVILPLLISAARSSFPLQGRPSRSHFRRRCKNPIFTFKNVKISPDAGFYAFNYRNAGIVVGDSFYFHADRPTVVTLLDCFCSGDSFQLFDNGVLLGETRGLDVEDNSCPHFSADPNVCLFSYSNPGDPSSNYWGLYATILNSGTHNLTIIPTVTPYGKGTGFIRIDYSCPPQASDKDGKQFPDPIFFPDGTFPCCVADNSCSVNTVN